MKTIYVVVGAHGEYSDHQEWLVRAFTSRDKAESHAFACKKRLTELGAMISEAMNSPEAKELYERAYTKRESPAVYSQLMNQRMTLLQPVFERVRLDKQMLVLDSSPNVAVSDQSSDYYVQEVELDES